MGKKAEWGEYLAEWLQTQLPGTVFNASDTWAMLRAAGYKMTKAQVSLWVGRRIKGNQDGYTQYKDGPFGLQSTGHREEWRYMGPGHDSYGMRDRAEMERARKAAAEKEAKRAERAERKAARLAEAEEAARREQEELNRAIDNGQVSDDVYNPIQKSPVTYEVRTEVILGKTEDGMLVVQEGDTIVLYQRFTQPVKVDIPHVYPNYPNPWQPYKVTWGQGGQGTVTGTPE